MFADLHPVHALATLVVRRSRPKRAVQKLMTFAFWRYSKFLAGDTLRRSSLVADGSNTYRIAAAIATCYLRCRSHRENERFGANNSRASLRYLREKIARLREPFHPAMHYACISAHAHWPRTQWRIQRIINRGLMEQKYMWVRWQCASTDIFTVFLVWN